MRGQWFLKIRSGRAHTDTRIADHSDIHTIEHHARNILMTFRNQLPLHIPLSCRNGVPFSVPVHNAKQPPIHARPIHSFEDSPGLLAPLHGRKMKADQCGALVAVWQKGLMFAKIIWQGDEYPASFTYHVIFA